MERINQKLVLLSALPITLVLALCFIAPLLVVMAFSIMPPKVFDLAHLPDFSNYSVFFSHGYYRSLLWSFGTALLSMLVLFVICWPLAFAMAKVFNRFTLVITIAVVITLFVSENIRLYGWVFSKLAYIDSAASISLTAIPICSIFCMP